MDFRLPTKSQAFQNRVAGFLEKELGTPFWNLHKYPDFDPDRSLAFCEAVRDMGWIGLWWPKEYGGQGAEYWHQLVLQEEFAYWDAPRGPMYIGWDRVAWALLLLGDDVQKRLRLQAIQSLDERWSQGFSEPGAGSDLASLRTSARRDGDDFVVNGQKTFNSYGHLANHCLVAVRTDSEAPKHRGISLLMVDLRSEGVTVRPLLDMRGELHFNDIYLQDVRVPVQNLLGEENRGWYGAMSTIDAERSGVAVQRLGWARRGLDALLGQVRESKTANPSLRTEVADLAIGCQVLRLLAYRVAEVQESGQVPNVESSMATLFGCELEQRIYYSTGRLGLSAQLMESSWAPMDGFFAGQYLHAAALTIGGGSSEIKRGVLATRGCGLPRS